MQFYAKDIMSDSVITVKPEMTAREVMDVMLANQISGVPIVDDNYVLVGVITMYDLLNAGASLPYETGYFEEVQLNWALTQENLHVENLAGGYVSDFMSRNVYTALPDTPIEEVAKMMYDQRIHRVIILKPDRRTPCGIVTTFDMLKLLAESKPTHPEEFHQPGKTGDIPAAGKHPR